MTVSKYLIPVISIALIVAVAMISIGFSYTSSTENSENNLDSSYLVLYPDKGSTYSGSFSQEVEFHTGITIKEGVRTTKYTPCSWYMRDLQGTPCYILGTINLAIMATDELDELALSMVASNPTSIYVGDEGKEFVYKLAITIDEQLIVETFDRMTGATVDLTAYLDHEKSTLEMELSLYLVAQTVDTKPGFILNETVFVFTASRDAESLVPPAE